MTSAVTLQVRYAFKGVKHLETCSVSARISTDAEKGDIFRATLPGKRTEDTAE